MDLDLGLLGECQSRVFYSHSLGTTLRSSRLETSTQRNQSALSSRAIPVGAQVVVIEILAEYRLISIIISWKSATYPIWPGASYTSSYLVDHIAVYRIVCPLNLRDFLLHRTRAGGQDLLDWGLPNM